MKDRTTVPRPRPPRDGNRLKANRHPDRAEARAERAAASGHDSIGETRPDHYGATDAISVAPIGGNR
ncbi:hypothetical protein C488_15097 [Natrinema pellirubrum DSM 15624]|uniref:Uncharacterized protein n=1 Tax=Natrinema pellirubrum (strain DSM 15624 / CIP 106293 / JCM 10476 / NCIMB 786 / 157) TaxID=797303 RepID=L0JKL7_NATP1|nr:hypothetical protein Natpe_1941 [Natrinema pellirubrum DSM 15624]ELY72348.1 hypothetical protein C488_15097 [Natrinema pellirubrum DSM 15624]